jgi:hypothetical protein
LEQFLVGHGVELQDVLGLGIDLRQRQEQVLGRDELVLHRIGFALGSFEDAAEFLAQLRRRAARHAGEMAQFGLHDFVQLAAVDADAIEDRADDAVVFGQERRQQVQRVDLRMPAVGRQLLGASHRLLGLERLFVESKCHGCFSPVLFPALRA